MILGAALIAYSYRDYLGYRFQEVIGLIDRAHPLPFDLSIFAPQPTLFLEGEQNDGALSVMASVPRSLKVDDSDRATISIAIDGGDIPRDAVIAANIYSTAFNAVAIGSLKTTAAQIEESQLTTLGSAGSSMSWFITPKVAGDQPLAFIVAISYWSGRKHPVLHVLRREVDGRISVTAAFWNLDNLTKLAGFGITILGFFGFRSLAVEDSPTRIIIANELPKDES